MHLLLSRLSRHRHIVGIGALSVLILSTAYPSYAFAETFSNKLHMIRGGGERNMNNHNANDPFSRSIRKVVIAGGTHGNEVRLVEATSHGLFSANS